MDGRHGVIPNLLEGFGVDPHPDVNNTGGEKAREEDSWGELCPNRQSILQFSNGMFQARKKMTVRGELSSRLRRATNVILIIELWQSCCLLLEIRNA